MASFLSSTKKDPSGKNGRVSVKKKRYQWVYSVPGKPKVSGEIDAESINVAKAKLRSIGKPFTYVKEVKVKRGKVKEDHIVLFLRQWSAVQSAGVPVVDGIDIIANTTDNAGLRELLKKIVTDIKNGEPLDLVFAKYPKYFDEVSVSLLKAAQESGLLDKVLARMATAREKRRTLMKKTRSALMYPGVTVVVMFVVVAVLMIKVIPVFSHLFKSFGGKLPWLTRQVIGLSYWMQDHVFLLIAIPPLVVFLHLYVYRRSREYRWMVDRAILKAPVFGQLLLKSATTRFCQIFAEMQGAGVPIVTTLETLEHVSGNTVIDKGVADARKEVSQGGRIAEGLKSSSFPKLAVQMISVGEDAGELEGMVAKTGDFYELEVNEMVDRMSTLLEPMIMILLGFVVGTLVIAMYLPMLDMGSVILKGTGVQ